MEAPTLAEKTQAIVIRKVLPSLVKERFKVVWEKEPKIIDTTALCTIGV